LHSAQLLLYSFDFAPIADLQAAGDWLKLEALMIDAARRLERAGADGIVICTNTMHKLYDAVQAAIDIPVLHIVDATASAMQAQHLKHPILLATRYTMEQAFYKGRLADKFAIDARVPAEPGRTKVHSIIYEELCRGIVTPAAKAAYLSEIEILAHQGADSVILGCTEVGMLIGASDTALPVFDTTEIHARAAVDFALSA
jgi:aspartate racemase